MKKLAKLRIQSAIAQQGCCFYCGLKMIEPTLPELATTGVPLRWHKYLRCTAEHLKARQDQGRDVAPNIVAACWWCNSRRHFKREDRAPAPDAYQQRVQSLMMKGCWHPVNSRAVDFQENVLSEARP